ncbi:MAG TPA: alpha/beta hydrolase [Haliangiales bacterium]|nr:alpha/beta hydrolase [Haliangiales bacterium]
MATFVIVHGAWSGGWSWVRVVDRLIAKGHRAYAPTLTGLGERSHLAGPGIDLATHVKDVVNEIVWKDLGRIVLVGHSYGGLVITGVAEQVRERIASIIYVDAFIPADGQSFADLLPGWSITETMIPPPPTSKGDYFDESDRAWVDAKATPQPAATFTQKLRVTGAYRRVPKKTYVRATGWDGFKAPPAAVGSDRGWTIRELACGHDVAIDAPDELVEILEACA